MSDLWIGVIVGFLIGCSFSVGAVTIMDIGEWRRWDRRALPPASPRQIERAFRAQRPDLRIVRDRDRDRDRGAS